MFVISKLISYTACQEPQIGRCMDTVQDHPETIDMSLRDSRVTLPGSGFTSEAYSPSTASEPESVDLTIPLA